MQKMNEDNKLAKWLDDRLDGEELKEFQASPEYDTYRKIKEFSAQLETPAMDMDATYAAIVAKRRAVKPEPKTIRLQPWLGRIAAVLVLALGITFFLYTNNTTTLMADAGERTEFELPDNSQVVLNAGSEASYKSWNWDSNREVELEGEAYFRVAKGQTFDVNTQLGKVTVVGTQFNVKARNGRFDVTCFEGKVKVTYNKEEILLTSGMSIAYDNGQSIKITDPETGQPGWINYEVSFTEEKLESVIDEIERQYKVTIDTKNVNTAETYTGTLPMNNLQQALEIITTLKQLKAEKTGNNKFVLLAE
jgi:ferric-dicitrate binding protein FerR (iron transport regulator)